LIGLYNMRSFIKSSCHILNNQFNYYSYLKTEAGDSMTSPLGASLPTIFRLNRNKHMQLTNKHINSLHYALNFEECEFRHLQDKVNAHKNNSLGGSGSTSNLIFQFRPR
jgi:hypothetical protein